MLGRALLKRCPLCGAGKLFTGWFRMKERCPGCGYLFEREEGFFLGAYVINLGIAQAMWIFEVEGFGPFLVESDLKGNSLFEAQNAKINPGIDKLYEGLRPPALKRYGETTSREDEVV